MAGTVSDSAQGYLHDMATMLRTLDSNAIDKYAAILFEAWCGRHSVYVFGNGGSAFTASHHVLDYVKTAEVPGEQRLQAYSLVDNIGLTTAIGNDIEYEDTFAYALESYASRGDIAVAISCSGKSPNVVKACRWAKDHNMIVVAMTGLDGGTIGPIADLHINVPSDNYGLIEDLHLSIGHIAAQLLQRQIFRQMVQQGAYNGMRRA